MNLLFLLVTIICLLSVVLHLILINRYQFLCDFLQNQYNDDGECLLDVVTDMYARRKDLEK